MDTQFLDSFSEEVWRTTYKHSTDTSIDDTLKRVATALASVEKTQALQDIWGRRFYDLLTNFKATCGGRILANAGTNWKGVTLMNCFVGPKPTYDQDSIEGIFSVLTSQVLTLKSEGGWGMNFSFIRPRGSFIHGIGVETPGAVKYMEIFNISSDVITAGSGKKKKDQQFGGKTKIRKGAMMAVLDCITGDSQISTLSGKIAVKDLVGKNPLLYCTNGKGRVYIRKAAKVWSKGFKETVVIKFDDDSHLKCTPDHLIMLKDGTYKAAKDLTFGDSVAVFHKRLYHNYYELGVTGIRASIPEHLAVIEYKTGLLPEDSQHVHHIDFSPINNQPENLEVLTLAEHLKKHEEVTRVLLSREQKKISDLRRGKTWEQFYGEERGQALRLKWSEARRRNKKPAWNKGLTGEEYKSHFSEGFSNQFVENSNHKVVSVDAGAIEEVFDISVPDFHNFVANGVFVHNCWHPDVEEYITAKLQEGRLNKFNLSVNCSNKFMDRVGKIAAFKNFIAKLTEEQDKNDNILSKSAFDSQLEELEKWDLVFPQTKHPKYKLEWDGNLDLWLSKGYPVDVHRTVKVSDLWELIMQSTYNRNDPGVLFLDRANETHCYSYGEGTHIGATNPCGEQTLPFGFVCNLGSINLTQFITWKVVAPEEPPYISGFSAVFDFENFEKYIYSLVRLLDNVNDLSSAPLKEYVDSIKKARRIGMGVMGWGSLLYMLRIRFASPEAEELKEKIMKLFTTTGILASVGLAMEKGMFEGCEPNKHADHHYFRQIGLDEETKELIRVHGIRNSALFSCQPTGNTGVLANVVSGGIEPLFLAEYTRTVIVDGCPADMMAFTPKYWEGEHKETEVFKWVSEGGDKILRGEYNGIIYKIDKNRGLTKEVACVDYGVRWLKERGLWDAKASWAVTSENLSVEEHITDMKGFAKWIDSSISKTVNISNDYPYESFKKLYLDAYQSGVLKGITTYRAGTMMSVLSASVPSSKAAQSYIPSTNSPKREKVLDGELHHFLIDGVKYYVAVGLVGPEKQPYEVFTGVNQLKKEVFIPKNIKTGKIVKHKRGEYVFVDGENEEYELTNGHSNDTADALTRVISTSLRHGADISFIVHQLEKTKGPIISFTKALARTLKKYIKDDTNVAGEECPECHGELHRREGCIACKNCSYTKCA